LSKFTVLDDELHEYMVAHGAREDEALRRIREEAAAMGEIAVMQIAPDEGALLALLARLLGARRALEIGTFTGYSAICIARGLKPGGTLVACEIDPERAAIAERNFAAAGVADRIDLRVAPATETLAGLEADQPFDFAFIDADKVSYPAYYEACLERLRPGGLIVLDNVLMDRRVLAPADDGASVVARLNEKLAADPRIDLAMIGVADGLSLARKRETAART
jgi:caffeoyl-CoA O-methyltransferase